MLTIVRKQKILGGRILKFYMARIGIISQSPTLTTGFGISTKAIADALASLGNTVSCFGLDQVGENFDRADFDYRIWAVGKTEINSLLEYYLKTEAPEVIIINFDIVNLGRYCFMLSQKGYTKGIIAHVVFDGTPFLFGELEFLHKCFKVVVPTRHTYDYLQRAHKIQNLIFQRQGINHDIFQPLQNRGLPRQNSVFGNKFIIGCFGRNTERKQLPTVLRAISLLKEQRKLNDFVAYFHCDAIDSMMSYDLEEICRYLNIEDIVYFKKYKSSISKLAKVPFFPELNLAGKMGICDVCVNIPFSGGVELHNLEAQACEVPLITTQDHGNIAEVVGEGAVLLDADYIGTWRTGSDQYFIHPQKVADAIYNLLMNSNLMEDLKVKGRHNVSQYSWNSLTKELDFICKQAA